MTGISENGLEAEICCGKNRGNGFFARVVLGMGERSTHY
jgi:hypothetical protein